MSASKSTPWFDIEANDIFPFTLPDGRVVIGAVVNPSDEIHEWPDGTQRFAHPPIFLIEE